MSSKWDDLVREIEGEIWADFSETVKEHANNPRNLGIMEKASSGASVTGQCGDTIKIWLGVEDDVIEKISFWTDGCGTTVAAGSMVTDLAKGKGLEEALKITGLEVLDKLGGLPDDSVHCAILATNALHEAIKNYKMK